MSFLLIVLLIAVILFAGFRLIRHDAKAPPGAESHGPRSGPPAP
jgi:hypothetical protein